jgi:hypothetical protein
MLWLVVGAAIAAATAAAVAAAADDDWYIPTCTRCFITEIILYRNFINQRKLNISELSTLSKSVFGKMS